MTILLMQSFCLQFLAGVSSAKLALHYIYFSVLLQKTFELSIA